VKASDAAELARRIRQHWHIENRLHWCKDVALQEDTTPLCESHALINMAVNSLLMIFLACFPSVTESALLSQWVGCLCIVSGKSHIA
jgi:hypothetical protein